MILCRDMCVVSAQDTEKSDTNRDVYLECWSIHVSSRTNHMSLVLQSPLFSKSVALPLYDVYAYSRIFLRIKISKRYVQHMVIYKARVNALFFSMVKTAQMGSDCYRYVPQMLRTAVPSVP